MGNTLSHIAQLFGGLPAARRLGLEKESFVVGHPKGRCEKCLGSGYCLVDLDLYGFARELCPICFGERFQRKVLEVEYYGKTISDVLRLSLNEALALFRSNEKVSSALRVAAEFVFGESFTLSDETAHLSDAARERLWLAHWILKGQCQHSLVLLDRPFVGLSSEEVAQMFLGLRRFVRLGGTLLAGSYRECEQVLADAWLVL